MISVGLCRPKNMFFKTMSEMLDGKLWQIKLNSLVISSPVTPMDPFRWANTWWALMTLPKKPGRPRSVMHTNL